MIIRRRHTANFTTISNVLFEDERLAADEVGVLAYLLSRPHDWEVRRPALMRRWRVGREAIKRIIFNLVRCGWCQPRKTRLSNGTYCMIYEIRDEPGPTLTEDEVRRALSLVSSEAATDETEVKAAGADPPLTGDPPTGYPYVDPPLTGTPPTGYPSLADPYVANKILLNTDSTKIEREVAREHERKAKGLIAFEARWPTSAADDRSRTAHAWDGLTETDREAALKGIGPFLENLKRLGRKNIPAGWKYLEEKRWALLEQKAAPDTPQTTKHDAGSSASRAIAVLYAIAGKTSFLAAVMRSSDGAIWYSRAITPQLLALAQSPPEHEWATLDYRQAGAWEDLLNAFVTVETRNHLQQGSRAPWPWPPRKDGSLCTGPPEHTLMTD